MGGAHSRVEACIASPHLSPLCQYTTHSSVPHTATVDISWVQHCSTNGKLCSLVKGHAAEHSKNLATPRSTHTHLNEVQYGKVSDKTHKY